jgi:hypothetical protein
MMDTKWRQKLTWPWNTIPCYCDINNVILNGTQLFWYFPPDEEPIKTKGENFSKLLQVTGTVQ